MNNPHVVAPFRKDNIFKFSLHKKSPAGDQFIIHVINLDLTKESPGRLELELRGEGAHSHLANSQSVLLTKEGNFYHQWLKQVAEATEKTKTMLGLRSFTTHKANIS
ncbi:MAG: hypothetical protein ACKO34_06190 [Vampirovibrionales bacterium]